MQALAVRLLWLRVENAVKRRNENAGEIAVKMFDFWIAFSFLNEKLS